MPLIPPSPRGTLRSLISAAMACLAFGEATAQQPVPRPTPPPEGDCPTLTATPSDDSDIQDSATVTLKEGMTLDHQQALMLRRLIPKEVWANREEFFFEGMMMEIGACHRRYAVPEFFRKATEEQSHKTRIDKHGNLDEYVAGLPFPPESIDPADEQAAVKWAWNMAKRFRGAGHRGSMRIVDFPSGLGGIQTFTGDFFLLQTAARSDLPEEKYEIDDADGMIFAAGGVFKEPFNARHLAWRQFRPHKVEERYEESDDIFIYIPTMRKMRRASAPWVDGVYLPRYSISGDSGGGGIAFGDALGGGGGSINPTAGQSIATSEHTRRGLLGLTLRPNAYLWRYRGEQIVLAPINVTRSGYPSSPDRNFGPSGLSVANDRWDVRYAVVIEGALRVPNEEVRTMTVFVDFQTQQPLYWISRTGRRRIIDVGILASRYTGDIADYPRWPTGARTEVFEPVGAFFVNVLAGTGGWRRESYDIRSVPFTPNERRDMTTSATLDRGH